MRSREKLPIGAAIILYVSRATIGIGLGASVVEFVYVTSTLIGRRIADRGLGDAALCVAILSLFVWLACLAFAWVADRMRGL